MALQQPIWNPILPFTGPILGGLSEGKMVVMQGQVRYPVKSESGVSERRHCLSLQPRFSEGHVVVCNTQQNGRWGPEQRVHNMPFQPGVYFEMILNVKSHGYQVSVNGSHFLEYSHRLPFHLVQKLFVNGDITVNCINFVGNTPPPYAPPAYNVVTATNVGGMFAQPRFVQTSISKKQKSKKTQGFSGVTLANPIPREPEKQHDWQHCSAHQPRFKEKVLVRNSFINGAWGPEERHGHAMPFSPSQAFHMEITNLRNNYRVIVNGQVVFDYTHRIPSGQVDQLEIAGDVTLSCVQY